LTDPLTLVDMFNRRWAQAPDAPFLLDPAGGDLSYGQTASLAGFLAARLDDLGLQAGDVVGLYMSNQPDWVVASLGAWSRGLIVAGISRLMPTEAADELLRLSDAKAVCVLADDQSHGPLAVPAIPVSMNARRVGIDLPLADSGPDSDAAILFTSGTTGKPKGLRSPHRRLAESARSQASSYASTPTFRDSVAPAGVPPIVSFTAYGHLAAYTSLALALWTGRRFALIEKFSVEAVNTLLEREAVKVLRLNPAAIFMLATTELPIDLSNLR
jgi:acyl-CoA synthetase (AMP-forming)/AMP-acid ligase II